MSEAEHVYTSPQAAAAGATPDEVKHFLDGSDLPAKTQALRLSTVDEDGWPHASLLSAGDMIMLPSGRVRFVVFPQSKTTANLVRDGRVTMTLALDGGMGELQIARAGWRIARPTCLWLSSKPRWRLSDPQGALRHDHQRNHVRAARTGSRACALAAADLGSAFSELTRASCGRTAYQDLREFLSVVRGIPGPL